KSISDFNIQDVAIFLTKIQLKSRNLKKLI
ncbi:MAG: hypothetical protein ACI848_000519, partial [Roseivirga sp.]